MAKKQSGGEDKLVAGQGDGGLVKGVIEGERAWLTC